MKTIMEKMNRVALALAVVIGLAACTANTDPAGEPSIEHSLQTGPYPWTEQAVDYDADTVRFAVFSDLTGGERDRVFEIAVAQLNLLRPEFIMNVGDLIEGDSADEAGLTLEWESFDERADRAKAPIFYAGGNHDLTGEMLRNVFEARYGRRYYHFVYKDVLFLILDTEDNTPARMQEIFEMRNRAVEIYQTEGPEAFAETEYANLPERRWGVVSKEQSDYFLDAIADNQDVRWTFLFVHKAPWNMPGDSTFAALERALEDRPYTVFHGHEHYYQYEQRNGRDYIQLATTGGEQFPESGRSADQVVLVTVDDSGVDIANLLMAGILDKTGHVPLGGDDVCFEAATCRE